MNYFYENFVLVIRPITRRWILGCETTNHAHPALSTVVSLSSSSWWSTEIDGWMGGTSASAKSIDITQRVSYIDGFHPMVDIPLETPITADDMAKIVASGRATSSNQDIRNNNNYYYNINIQNELGILRLLSWRDYYLLRQIPHTSPMALLCTYPLTLYYGITEYGQVPCTVAYQIQHRPLRIHIVGVEKELNLIDLYKEVSFLLPSDFHIELVFCIRDDMIPSSVAAQREHTASSTQSGSLKKTIYTAQLTETLRVVVTCGIYGDATSLHPNFDCGSGPPDIIVAYNAGLYAYESWRSVISYLYTHRNVLGIFTDYNEHSAVQCANILGGHACRNTVRMNPFRQPRAMPVYSMNLPQFGNGFIYVVNEQSLE
jgi:hypothetical protein